MFSCNQILFSVDVCARALCTTSSHVHRKPLTVLEMGSFSIFIASIIVVRVTHIRVLASRSTVRIKCVYEYISDGREIPTLNAEQRATHAYTWDCFTTLIKEGRSISPAKREWVSVIQIDRNNNNNKSSEYLRTSIVYRNDWSNEAPTTPFICGRFVWFICGSIS